MKQTGTMTGEDPFLASRIGVAFVKGLQGDDPRYFKVISTPKHFAVHSGPEPLRHTFDVDVSNRDLYETYLPAFKACMTEGEALYPLGYGLSYSNFQYEKLDVSSKRVSESDHISVSVSLTNKSKTGGE